MKIRFLKKDGADWKKGINELKTETGYIKVSNPELTGLDLMRYTSQAGGMNFVSTVLAELSEQMKAVELLNVGKKECIVIENAVLGVEAAKKADIYCIGVPTYVKPSELDRADLVVGDHQKLMEHLLSLEPLFSPEFILRRS